MVECIAGQIRCRATSMGCGRIVEVGRPAGPRECRESDCDQQGDGKCHDAHFFSRESSRVSMPEARRASASGACSVAIEWRQARKRKVGMHAIPEEIAEAIAEAIAGP